MLPRHRSPAIPYLGVWIPLLGASLGVLLWLTMPSSDVMKLSLEAGPIETVTQVLWFVLAVGIWTQRGRGDDVSVWLAFFIVFIAFGAREMDLHKAWTGISVLKISFYFGEASPLQKTAGLSSILVVGVAAAYLVRRLAGSAWEAVRSGISVGVTTLAFAITIVISKLLDRSINVLAEDFGMTFELSTRALIGMLEEILELSLPLLVAVGFLQNKHTARGLRSKAAG